MSIYSSLTNTQDGKFDTLALTTAAAPSLILECEDYDGTAKWATMADLAVTGVQGTANQVLVNGTSGSMQLGNLILTTPQSIAQTSDVVFNSVTTPELIMNGVRLYNTTSGTFDFESKGSHAMSINNTDVIVDGNLTVNGSLTYLATTTFEVKDNLINVGYGNPYDTVDLGILFSYNTATTPNWGAIYKVNGTNKFRIKTGLTSLPSSVVSGGTFADLEINDLTLASVYNNIISSTQWGQIATINQNLATTSSPTFVTVNAALNGNATTSTTTATVTNATQSAITTLPNLNSIQSTTIGTSKWPLVASMQNVATSATPTFSTVSATTGAFTTVNATNINSTYLYGQIQDTNQGLIATLPSLANVQGSLFNSTKWAYLATANQNLSTTSNVTFGNIGGTLTTASQPNVTELKSLGNVQGFILPNPCWGYLATMNQNVATTSSPTFVGIGGTLSSAAQPNVTSVGLLTGLAINGTVYNNIGVNQLHYVMRNGTSIRWGLGMAGAETGSNNGSDAEFYSYGDTGLFLNRAFSISRSLNNRMLLDGPLQLSTVNDNTNGNVTSGVYTPTISGLVNITATSIQSFTYQRIGNIVSVMGYLNCTHAAGTAHATNYQIRFTKPIASSGLSAGFTIGSSGQSVGYGNSASTSVVVCSWFNTINTGAGSTLGMFFTGQYSL